MTLLEGTVLLLLLLLALPGLCQRIRRPGLLYPLYIAAGAVAGFFMQEAISATWREVGQFGFILLLFSVGLETEIPDRREGALSLRRSLLWMAVLGAPVVGVLLFLDFGPLESLVTATALSSTSVGMAYALWKHHPFATPQVARDFLQWMVAVEVLSILALAVFGPVLMGATWWLTVLKLLGLVLAAVGTAWTALHWVPLLARTVSRGTQLDIALVVVLLFALCAVGNRLGLSAPKTAFVLGLFISRATEEEVALSHRLAPLRDRMFVPIFFFGLGTLIQLHDLFSWHGLAALLAGVLLFAYRRLMFALFMGKRLGCETGTHAIAAPVLTIAAVAVDVLVHGNASSLLISITLLAGVSLTLCAAFNPIDDRRLVDLEPTLTAPEALAELAHEGSRRSEPKPDVAD